MAVGNTGGDFATQFYRLRASYFEQLDKRQTALEQHLVQLEQSPPGDFRALMKAIFATEQLSHPAFEQLHNTYQNLWHKGQQALQAQQMPYDTFVETMAISMNKSFWPYKMQRIYAMIPRYTGCKARTWVNAYMNDLAAMRTSPQANPFHMRNIQAMLVHLGAYLPQEDIAPYLRLPPERQPVYFKEVADYRKSGLKHPIAPIPLPPAIEAGLASLEQARVDHEALAALLKEKAKLTRTPPSDPVGLAEQQLEWEIAACRSRLKPIGPLLKPMLLSLTDYEQTSQEAIERFLGITHCLTALEAIRMKIMREDLVCAAAVLQITVRQLIAGFPDASSQTLHSAIAQYRGQLEQLGTLLGVNLSDEEEETPGETAQRIREQIHHLSEYIEMTLAEEDTEPIMVEQIALLFRQLAEEVPQLNDMATALEQFAADPDPQQYLILLSHAQAWLKASLPRESPQEASAILTCHLSQLAEQG